MDLLIISWQQYSNVDISVSLTVKGIGILSIAVLENSLTQISCDRFTIPNFITDYFYSQFMRV